jgi:hypothetical protein
VYNNNKREVILETYIRYGPKIIWHGENIAEIIVPTGSPFTHSYFYDFEDNQISSSYRGCCKTPVLQQQPLKKACFVRL